MKIYVWKIRRPGKFDSFEFASEEEQGSRTRGQYIGTLEVTEPKQTVTKEAAETCPEYIPGCKWSVHHFHIPTGSKNIKCTYEIEE